MCGICGVVYADPQRRLDRARLERMNAALVHRGPDDTGLWLDGGAGLAMRRLSVIDLAGGHQPMRSEDGRFTLVFNGEIYNFRDLRRELESHGYGFRTQSDTEVVLCGLVHWGARAFDRFNGMFAIALYDALERRLLLARDRLGIKPLYYCAREGAFAFASELEALRHSGLVRDAINRVALDAYLEFGYVPAPDAIYEDAHKLMPGELLVYQDDAFTVERYWELKYNIDSSWTLKRAAAHFADLLDDAVQLQRVADVPLGAFLSGGLDSSSVVAMMARHAKDGPPIKTFTIGFDDPSMDESAYARLAAAHLGTEHHERIMRPDTIALLPRLIRHFGEPFADSSAIPTWLVSQFAREHVTVVLSGDGGDELFAGYTWTHVNRSVDRYRRLPRALRRFVDKSLFFAPESPRMAKLRRFNQDSFLEPYASFRRRHGCFTKTERLRLYPDAQRRALFRAADRFLDHNARVEDISPDDWMLRHDTAMYLPDDILTKVDRMSMANSLEARVPLLDHRIVEFAATVPFALKLHHGVSKRVLKRALRPLLPPRLLRQRKHGFGIPIHRWFREELRDHFRELVLVPDARIRGYLETAPIQRIFEAHQQGRENYGHHLYSLLVLEHWLRLTSRGV